MGFFMKTYFLPIGLIAAIVGALVVPAAGQHLAQWHWTSYFVAVIFFINGFDFRSRDLKFEKSLLIHTMMVSLLSLMVAPQIAYLLTSFIPLPLSWMIGFYVIACVPTTLSSGIVIASLAGGHRPLAVLLTIGMSFMGIFTLPWTLSFLLEGGFAFSVNRGELMLGLCLTVLLPFLVGLWCKRALKTDYQFGNYYPSAIVIMIVYVSAAQSSQLLYNATLNELGKAILISCLLHVILMVLCWIYAFLTTSDREYSVTILFCGSQKTLPLSVAVLSDLSTGTGNALIICIVFHFFQLIFDSLLASHLPKVFFRTNHKNLC